MVLFLVILMIYIYKQRQLNAQRQDSEQDPVPPQEPVPEIELDNFDIENFDSLAPWERNAHIWINEQILSIKNENYEQ